MQLYKKTEEYAADVAAGAEDEEEAAAAEAEWAEEATEEAEEAEEAEEEKDCSRVMLTRGLQGLRLECKYYVIIIQNRYIHR